MFPRRRTPMRLQLNLHGRLSSQPGDNDDSTDDKGDQSRSRSGACERSSAGVYQQLECGQTVTVGYRDNLMGSVVH